MNEWVELLRDWEGWLFFLACGFLFALEKKWRRK